MLLLLELFYNCRGVTKNFLCVSGWLQKTKFSKFKNSITCTLLNDLSPTFKKLLLQQTFEGKQLKVSDKYRINQ